jgi:ABC-type phosphate transport system permease subunit
MPIDQLLLFVAAGLVLFAITLMVNVTATWFIARSRSGASSDA